MKPGTTILQGAWLAVTAALVANCSNGPRPDAGAPDATSPRDAALDDSANDTTALDGAADGLLDAVSDATVADNEAEAGARTSVLPDGPNMDVLSATDAWEGSAFESGSFGAESDAESDASASDGSGVCSPCKACFGQCVALDTPEFGCGSGDCAPCSLSHATPTCASGACSIGQCDPGWSDCDHNPSNGCETSLVAPSTCGSCGQNCSASQACAEAGCVDQCPAGTFNCAGSCQDIQSSPLACGSCTNASCPVPPSQGLALCSNGQCSVACRQGFTMCGTACTDTASDPNACGSCNQVCSAASNAAALCANGQCSSACAVGYSPCSPSLCADLNVDSANCGSCGKSCGSQICASGSCVAVSSLSLISGLIKPEDITTDALRIYWTDPGSDMVQTADKSGGTLIALASGEPGPWRIAVDDSFVYWTNSLGTAIRRAPKLGGVGPKDVAPASQAGSIAVDDSYVYWFNGGDSNIWRAPKDGSAAGAVFFNPGAPKGAADIAIDADFVYVAAIDVMVQGSLYKLTKAGSVSFGPIYFQSYSDTTGGPAIAVDCANVFYSAILGSTEGFYWAAKSDGAIVGRNLAVGFGLEPHQIVTDSNAIYVVSGPAGAGGIIWQMGRWAGVPVIGSGFPPTTTNPSVLVPSGTANVNRIAVDGDSLYWTDSTFIGRMPK
jgi:hypothetical protein